MWEEFGTYLRDRRKESGLTLDQAASAIGQSSSLLGKLERGERVCQRSTAKALEDLYGTNGTLLDRWTRAQARSNDPARSRQATECEARAADIKQFNGMVVPGILQVPAYASALFADGRPGEETASVVAARCSRLESLSAALEYVIPHRVLRTKVGSTETMAEQTAHMIKLIEGGRIRVQVLSDSAATNAGLAGHFRLFSFHNRLPMAYAEHVSGGVLIDDAAEVHRLGALWGILSAFAYDPSRSCNLIKEAEREYRMD